MNLKAVHYIANRVIVVLCIVATVMISWAATNIPDEGDDSVLPAAEGLKAVRVDLQWGFANVDGQIVIETQYQEVRPFAEGLAAVRKGGLWGFVNRRGNVLLDSKYEQARDFSEGLAAVRLEGGAWAYVDREARITVHGRADWDPRSFSEGVAAVHVTGEGVGYIDRKGEWIIEPKFADGGPFEEGVAVVQIDGKWGYITHSGEFLIEPTFKNAYSFRDGIALVRLEDGSLQFILHQGTPLVDGLTELQLAEATDSYGWANYAYYVEPRDALFKLVDKPVRP